MRYLKKNWLAISALTLLVVICYLNSLSGQFVLDDIDIITHGRTLGNWHYIVGHPLVSGRDITMTIMFSLFGRSPFAFHVLNLLFHLGTIMLLYVIITLLSGSMAAFFAASIFAVHPVVSESVSWISGGAYPQYSFFFLLSFLLFIKSEKKKLYYLLSLLCALLAFISSDKALVLPLILFLYLISFKNIKKTWKKLLPYFAMSALWIWYYGMQINTRVSQMKLAHYDTDIKQNPLIQIPLAITSYFHLILFPNDLSIYHTDFSTGWFMTIFRSVVFLLYIGALMYYYKKNKYIFFWLAFFIVSLGTTLTPFGISSTITERYVYLGTAGICAIVGYIAWKISSYRTFNITTYLLVIFILMIFSVRTIVRNLDWQNEDTLWIATSKTSINDPAPHINVGDVYRRRGDIISAEREFKIALALNPGYADAYNNLGVLYLYSNRNEIAEENYKKAISLNPKLWQAYEGLGLVYAQRKEYAKTVDYIKKAISIMPDDGRLYSNLGVAYFKLHKNKEAQDAFLKSLVIDPSDETAQKGLEAITKSNTK